MKAERAAAYLDMSRSKFLELVEQGRLPKPKIIDGIRVWDRLGLEAAFKSFRIAVTMIASKAGGIPSMTRRGAEMATLRLRYVHSFVDRTGRVRYYFRHRGQRWPLPGQPGTVEFSARYDELSRQFVASKPGRGKVAYAPQTMGAVIVGARGN
jgi:hypothetical protein